MKKSIFIDICSIILIGSAAAGCAAPFTQTVHETPTEAVAPVPATPDEALPTPQPTRETYAPGTLVDYTAQTGDTLLALAAHFNTSVDEIRAANPIIPDSATTMPPGMPMKIPIYYEPFWSSSYQIIPDSLFINGPAQVGFDASAFVASQPGWFKNYSFYLGERNRRGGEIVDYIAENFSISPRLLLAVLEYQTGALSNAEPPDNVDLYPLGFRDQYRQGIARQLIWAANVLNNGYYGWRSGKLDVFYHRDRTEERVDPWQNAATASLQVYFARVLPADAYTFAVSGDGFQATYAKLFGNPWENVQPHITGSLSQPELLLPFTAGKSWAFTGGPHTGWGEGDPLAAIDFAPPSLVSGCQQSEDPATALASGVIAWVGDASLILDLDSDGDERTGWVIYYLHLANASLPKVGTVVEAGDPVGMPSCEGGTATGTHVHIARKYNGEWILAEGALAFNLEGWLAQNGSEPYQGTLTRFGKSVRACDCSDQAAQIKAAEK